MSVSELPRFAWSTLLSHPDYLAGVNKLQLSLRRAKTRWPLVVMVTDAISLDIRRALGSLGCIVRPVAPIRPPSSLQTNYATKRFDQTWTKLRAWQLTDFSRVVLLDADMLVLQNMDELFLLDLQGSTIAACYACRCNPENVTTYPATWRPENCHYTWLARSATAPETLDRYLNSGLVVLQPDQGIFADISARVAAIEDLSNFLFSEQDLLNIFFARKWMPLPYVYNALKTLPYQHSDLWQWHDVKNIHYILDKPWNRDPAQPRLDDDRYYDLDHLWWSMTDSAADP